MNHRAELGRLVETMSEAEVDTVLKFVQFLEQGHVRPRVGDSRRLMKQAKVIIDDLVEIVDLLEQPEVELVHAPRGAARPAAATRHDAAVARPDLLEGALKIPRSEWGVVLDGFSHLFHDLACHLWVRTDGGDTYTLARNVPLGQVYFDAKGSERNAVQVALNRSGSTYGDFRFMHRIGEPEAIYLREAADDELVDVIVKSAGQLTLLETSLPDGPHPGVRRLAFLTRLSGRPVTGERAFDAEPRH